MTLKSQKGNYALPILILVAALLLVIYSSQNSAKSNDSRLGFSPVSSKSALREARGRLAEDIETSDLDSEQEKKKELQNKPAKELSEDDLENLAAKRKKKDLDQLSNRDRKALDRLVDGL